MRPSGRRWWAVLTDVGLVALLVTLGLATTLGAYRALAQKADAQQRELLNAMGQSVVARDAGSPVASETFALIRRGQDGPVASGFAVSALVYRAPRPAGVNARQAALAGFTAGGIEVPELMREAALRASANELDLFVFDQDGQRRLIYASAGRESFREDERDTMLSVDVGDRPWQLVLRPRPGFVGGGRDEAPLLAAVAGSVATLLLALAVSRSLLIWRRLGRTEAVLAVDRQHLANVLDGTAAGTWDWHIDSGRLVVNERRAQALHDDARALEAANRQLRDLAIVDALTGAFSRRHFKDVCLAALAGAQRGQAVALRMLDVDFFKAYSDHDGHQAGDAVLKTLAQTLRRRGVPAGRRGVRHHLLGPFGRCCAAVRGPARCGFARAGAATRAQPVRHRHGQLRAGVVGGADVAAGAGADVRDGG